MDEQCTSQTTATTSCSANAGDESGNNGDAESEDSDDSSSSSALTDSVEKDLENFRRQWQNELANSSCAELRNINCLTNLSCQERHVEEQAGDLYLQGVKAERKGHLYEAISFYRRAVQLVPDIEFRVTELLPKFKKENVGQDYDGSDSGDEGENVNYLQVENAINDNGEERFQDLTVHFNKLCSKNGKICQPAYDSKASHISSLPREILIYICKWIISCDLDMRSLEQLSLVSRGFYLCSRDAELWRLSCMRIWGVNCGSPNKYGTWRDMFIKRPRLRYNGAYISKTTYIRPGEPGFQDQSYRPWHIVDYYRYLRFFPEGIVLMMTTPEEPLVSLSKLKHRNTKHSAVLMGHYRLHGNLITATLQRSKYSEAPVAMPRFRRLRQQQQQDLGEQAFHLDLEVMTFKNRANYKLEWRRYSVHTIYRNGQESISDFDLTHAKFPPFWFSRVKSYTAVSEKPL